MWISTRTRTGSTSPRSASTPENGLLPAAEAALSTSVQARPRRLPDGPARHSSIQMTQPEVAAAILTARLRHGRTSKAPIPISAGWSRCSRRSAYNTNATLAENLLFGAPIGDDLSDRAACGFQDLCAGGAARETGSPTRWSMSAIRLAQHHGRAVSADLPPDHDYFRQFSFISAEDLPDYRTLIGKCRQQRIWTSPERDGRAPAPARAHLQAHPRAPPPRSGRRAAAGAHRRGAPTASARASAGSARGQSVAFFEPDQLQHRRHHPGQHPVRQRSPIGQAQAKRAHRRSDRRGAGNDLDLRGQVIEAGLQAEVGVAGARLSLAQRQKLALARALLKRPGYSHSGGSGRARSIRVSRPPFSTRCSRNSEGRTLIWTLGRSELAAHFDHVLVMRQGQDRRARRL